MESNKGFFRGSIEVPKETVEPIFVDGWVEWWNYILKCNEHLLVHNRTSLSFADRMSHRHIVRLVWPNNGLTFRWRVGKIMKNLSQPCRMLRKLHVALRDIWRAWQQRCLNTSSKDGKFWKWEYCFPTMSLCFFIARSQNGYGSNIPTSKTNINRRYPQMTHAILQSFSWPRATQGEPPLRFNKLHSQHQHEHLQAVPPPLEIPKISCISSLGEAKREQQCKLDWLIRRKPRDGWEHSVTLEVFLAHC